MKASITALVEVISLEEAKSLLKVGESTLDKYRKEWIQGIHFFQPETGAKITYNKPMVLVWLIASSCGDMSIQDRAMEIYLRAIPGNDGKTAVVYATSGRK